MTYLDQPLIEGFQAEVTAQMADAIEFAVNIARRDDEGLSEDELRQAAQDALVELSQPLVASMCAAYERAFKSVEIPMTHDPEAVAHIFTRLATRATLHALSNRPDLPVVRIHTRKGDTTGTLHGVIIKEGEEVVTVGDGTVIPVVSIIDVEEVERTP